MKTRLLPVFLLGSLCVSAYAQAPQNENDSTTRVRRTILNSRHLGAHGRGYNDQTMEALSRKLTPSDIPILVNLSSDT